MNESQFESTRTIQKSESRVPKYSDKFKDLLNKSQRLNFSKQKINQLKINQNNSNPSQKYQNYYQNFNQKINQKKEQKDNNFNNLNNNNKTNQNQKQKEQIIQIQTPFVDNKIYNQFKDQSYNYKQNDYQFQKSNHSQLNYKSNQYQSLIGQYKFITNINIKKQNQKQLFFYRVKSIGVGAHSFVYLTQQQSTQCLYAQKSIVKHHALNNINQLLNQIKIQYRLNHDNLISLYHYYSDQSYVYLIMQYAQESLFNLKTKFGIFKEKQVIEILRQLLHGIQYMHRKGYIHADIKIQNVMIRNGRIKLCDFGYATKWKQNQKIDPNTIIGTLQYLSPQYVDCLDTGPLRDIWAMGILCFQLWTGKNILEDLKQNQKWLKLTNPDYQVYLNQLQKIEKQQNRKSQKLEKFIQYTLCHYEQRYSAQKLLKLQFFNIINSN